jgi:predicted NodU family carbamoyl transferase
VRPSEQAAKGLPEINENEPICCTPEEAVDTFWRTHMDVLVLGPFYVEKP